jgi:O-antigen ligase
MMSGSQKPHRRKRQLRISSHLVVDTKSAIDLELDHEPRSLQWAFVVGLSGLLIFAILALGAVNEWSTFVFEAGAALLFLLWAGEQLVSGQVKFSKNPLYLPAFLFLLLPLAQLVLRTTAYSYITKYELLQYVAYGIVLLIASECIREESARKGFALVLIGFGVLYAFFALAQELTSSGKFFWFYTPRYHGSIYGSYVNHNHYAGLMEMLVPFPLILCMGHIVTGGQRALIAFAAVLMASTIVLSGSRGGMLSFTFEMVVFAALTIYQRRSPRIALGTFAVCLLVLAFLLFLGKGEVLGRLGELGPDMRSKITKDCFGMFVRRPVLGWGLGTFPTVYPSFRSFYTNLFVNEAHNDYAQLLVETGLLGFGLMLWFVFLLFRAGLPTSRRWEFKWNGAVSLAALLGCTALLVHSLVDFNLQIPANAAFFYVLCALAASRPQSTSAKRGPSRASTRGDGNGSRTSPFENNGSMPRFR